MATTLVRPGVNTTIEARPRPKLVPTDTGLAMWIGLTERGPVGTAVEVNGLTGYIAKFGGRTGNETMYDSADAYFRSGGSRLVVSRVAGPAPVKATKTLNDRAATPLPTIRVDADGPGAWGNSLTIDIANGVTTNTFIIIIKRNGAEVERSYELASPAEAVAWSTVSAYVRVVDLASATVAPNNNPAVVAAQALIGGTDDRTNALDAQWNTALAAFTAAFGPGQVAAPGRTTQQLHRDVTVHCNNVQDRTAILDAQDTASISTLDAALDALRAGPGDETYAGVFGPWVTIPGLTRNTTRTVPPSALVCATIARRDAAVGHANHAPIGDNGVLTYAIGLTQSWSDADRQTLNETGLNVLADPFGIGEFALYAWRTAADAVAQPEWVLLSWQRFRMQLRAEGQSIGKRYFGETIDGAGRLLGRFKTAWNGRMKQLYDLGAVFGATAPEAYRVDVDPPVNTVATAALFELNAQVTAKFSPFAEQVNTVVVKVDLREAL
jgi:hypothetical protein